MKWSLRLLLGGAGLALGVGLFTALHDEHSRRVVSEFERAAADRSRAIEAAFRERGDMTAATGAFVRSTVPPRADGFARFAQILLQRSPGTQGLSWVPRVTADARPAFEAEWRQHQPEFAIREVGPDGVLIPAGVRPEYFPVLLLEPEAGNERALGFDLASEARRRAALERARETGRPTATARIRLVQEKGEQFSFLIAQAVHRTRASGPGAPRDELAGYVTQVVRVRDLVETALSRLEPGGVDVTLLDASAPEAERWLYYHLSRRANNGAPRSEEGLSRASEFEAAGRRWRVLASAAPGLFSTNPPGRAWAALATVLAFAGLLGGYLELLQRRARELAGERSRLEERVRERTAQLERAHGELVRKERLAVLGQLTATVAHELRNPLTALQGSLQLLAHKLGGSSAVVDRALERGQRNIERSERIVRELLDFTRMHEVALERRPLDAWLVDQLEEYEPPPGITLTWTPDSRARVNFDSELLRRALLNLLDNACQAVELAKTTDPCVRVATRLEGDRAILAVSDNGPGIPAEHRERIFEPLFSTKAFGIGLGLPTVRRIARQHRGELAVLLPPTGGTCVELALPGAEVDA